MFRCPRGWSDALLAAIAVFTQEIEASETVTVAAVHFPPYSIKPEQQVDSGLLGALVAALNRAQGDYRFVLRATSLNRRFDDFRQARIDMALFENPAWDWSGIEFASTEMGLEDAEVLVARREVGRDQHYFDRLQGRRLALFNGYHYGFAGFNSDPKWLEQHFNAVLTYSHESNLGLVLRGRADIAPITRSWLGARLHEQPKLAEQLLVSEHEDQRYKHFALIRPQAPISAQAFADLLDELRENGELQRIFVPYGIVVRPSAADSSTAADVAD